MNRGGIIGIFALHAIAISLWLLLRGNGPAPTLLPNPSPTIASVVRGASWGELRRVTVPADWELNITAPDRSFPDEMLSPPQTLSETQFQWVRYVAGFEPRTYNATPPAALACRFHPDLIVLLYDANGHMTVTLTICLTCREWWIRTATESAVYPLPDADRFAALWRLTDPKPRPTASPLHSPHDHAAMDRR